MSKLISLDELYKTNIDESKLFSIDVVVDVDGDSRTLEYLIIHRPLMKGNLLERYS
ncbi:MAG: hypothetical protein ABIB71_08680 [Candidatus Woesearchaeota archaeon]